jgi:hypothetical protein
MSVCPRITGKDYENAGSTPLVNNDTVIKALRDVFKLESRLRDKKDFEDVLLFYGDNIPYFKKLWGRQSVCWTGYGRFWIWKHELDYCDLYALVAPERGTSYEVVVKDGQDKLAGEELEGFFTLLREGIRELKQ